MTRLALRSGARALKLALRSVKKVRAPRRRPVQRTGLKSELKRASAPVPRSMRSPARKPQWSAGMEAGVHGIRRYRLFKPKGIKLQERLPLVVMLHGCTQDAQALAASTRMNRLAQAEGFWVLYPEQDRLANLQRCWNWYGMGTGLAQREADSIASAVDHVCHTHAVDPRRVALVGISAGASLASLLAMRQPARFAAVVMHSGVGPGLAHSSASALAAMRGRHVAGAPNPLVPLASGVHLPALLVIQGSADPIVAASNGALAAERWAQCEGAQASAPRHVQRGKRLAVTVTDYRKRDRLVATLCVVAGLGHAWSGGAPGVPNSDPRGPDASRMAWAFVRKQFQRASPANL